MLLCIAKYCCEYLYANSIGVIGIKRQNVVLAHDDRLQCKLHLEAGMWRTQVPVQCESVQVESNVNVSTNTSVWSQVAGNSGSLCAVDLSRLSVLQVSDQIVGKTHNWHSTQHVAGFHVGMLDSARLQRKSTSNHVKSTFITVLPPIRLDCDNNKYAEWNVW